MLCGGRNGQCQKVPSEDSVVVMWFSGMVEFSSKIIPDEWLGHFDMLRDHRRNSVYSHQIQLFQKTQQNDEEYWIDIGCGSGLLGCLIGKYLRMKVIAFECVPRLAKIARQTIQMNNLQEHVTVWLVHTTDLDSQFMERTFGRKASYVVSELLDTTLLGEGLYEGLIHASSNLIKPPLPPRRITSIPHLARVFVQAWGGECISNGKNLSEISLTRLGLSSCSEFNICVPSSASTIQWSYYHNQGAFPLSSPVEIFDFDFSNLSTRLRAQVIASLTPLSSVAFPVEVNAIVMFWGCCCCTTSSDNSSCCNSMNSSAVFHTRGDPEGLLTDHWRQSVFFLNSKEFHFETSSDSLQLRCCHNEDDLWIQKIEVMSPRTVPMELGSPETEEIIHPICRCGLHSSYSSFQIREMNSRQSIDWILEVTEVVDKFIKNLLQSPSLCGVIFIITDDLLCPNSIAKLLETVLAADDTFLSPPRLKFAILYTSKSALNASKLLFESNCPNGLIKEIMEFHEIGASKDGEESDEDIGSQANCDSITLTEFVELIATFKRSMIECHGIEEMVLCPLTGVPYLSDLHDEGIFHHLLSLHGFHELIFQECQERLLIPSGVSFKFTDESFVNLSCGLFSSKSLWHQYTGEIGLVEGVDMSAINILMDDISSQWGDMKCVRLSQWNAEDLSSVTAIGRINSFVRREAQVGQHEPGDEILWEGKTSLTVDVSGAYHGVALFTTLRHLNGNCFFSTNPRDSPNSIQHFRCFDQESLLAKGTKLEIFVKITRDHRVMISLK